ncbi:MAG: TonB-dependent receptor plug domain-containing protein [Bacteroidetes bacterium]|nr:TonB-dependent receptor plug domain-containing protein [Bacteroidota bacterium]
MQKLRLIYPLLLLLLASYSRIHAQADSTVVKNDTLDYYEMSLEQLLNLKSHGVPTELEKLINSLISVASKKPLNVRESPSIVSLITEEEIKKSGARDLIDVLRLVPGIDFGSDVEGVVGIGMRGNWAHEGKVLVLLDGQEMNEILFACNMFGNHYPIEQIKKIEVIRGPGSAIYGGYAEYGVINIITRQAEDINGVTVSGTYGQMEKDFGRRNVNLMMGKKIGDFSFSLSGMMGQGQRSDQTYRDFNDSSYSMAGNSALNPKYFNAALAYKGLSFRVIGDFLQTTMRNGYGNVIRDGTQVESFNSVFSELKYIYKVNSKLTITPRINYKTQTPWLAPAYDNREPYNKTATRTTGNITASYNVNRYVNIVFGSELYRDVAVDHTDSSYFLNKKQTISFYNYAFFAQGLIKTRLVNFIVGARFDKHNAYGQAFVPRVGLTKKYNRFHFKALYSSAFRAPAIENINAADSNGIKPELTQVMEIELGYQLTHKSIFTVNVYDIETKDPIIYYTSLDSSNTDLYKNFGHAGTQGIEAEYRIKDKWGHFTINYAFYSAANKQKVDLYKTENSASLLGFSNHRLNLNAGWNITKKLSFNTTASFYGARWAVTSLDSAGKSVQELLAPQILLNCFLRYMPVKGLSIGVGVYDILNQKFKLVQPYDGGSPPLPAQSRELVFRLQYDLNFKKKQN